MLTVARWAAATVCLLHSMYIQNATTKQHVFCFLHLLLLPSAGGRLQCDIIPQRWDTGMRRLSRTSALEWSCPSSITLLLTYSSMSALVKNNHIASHFFLRGNFTPVVPGREVAGRVQGQSAQFRVRIFSSSSGLRSVGLFPPAAAISACTAASQANESRAAGTCEKHTSMLWYYIKGR